MGKIPEYFIGYLWEKGRKERNQDALAFWWMNKKNKHSLMGVVCDGIGGLQEGENASTYVVRQLVSWFLSEGYCEKRISVMERRIRQLLYQLHTELKEYGQKKEIALGSTASLFIVKNKSLLWVHIGDSRIYYYKRGKVKRLTRDHKEKNGALNRAVGVGQWKLPDMGRIHLGKKERILICTDGFYRGMREEDLKILMARQGLESDTASRMLKQIYQKKRSMGESDDISALFLGFQEG